MNARKLLSTLCALMLLAALLPAQAAPLSPRDLSYAYLNTSTGYMIVGREVQLEVVLPEGAPAFSYEFNLYYTPDREQTREFQGIDRVKAQEKPSYSFTPDKPGQYFVEAVIMDKEYRSLTLQSEPFYCYEAQAELDQSTLPGKVKAIVREARDKGVQGDYDTALYLHDWLTHNADYDEPMTIHTPEGVLLQGKGVCESYALAYQMLLREAGLTSQYVTGYSRGESHAWNLVRIDGEWTYVDSTWDDPVGGGKEGYDYFGMSGAQLARDHDWTVGKQKPPEATATRFNYLHNNGWLPFDSVEGLHALLSRELESLNPKIKYSYTGTDKYLDLQYEIEKWMRDNAYRFFADSYTYGGSKYAGSMDVTYGDYSGYSKFTDDASFDAAMDQLLKAKSPEIRLYYQGTDRYFDLGSALRRWLADRAESYGLASYEYNYTPYHGILKLSYR